MTPAQTKLFDGFVFKFEANAALPGVPFGLRHGFLFDPFWRGKVHQKKMIHGKGPKITPTCVYKFVADLRIERMSHVSVGQILELQTLVN